jgi:hypothetical protein
MDQQEAQNDQMVGLFLSCVPLYFQAERLSAREVEKDMAKLKQHLDEIQITLRSEKENLQAARRTVGGQWFRHVGFTEPPLGMASRFVIFVY